MKKSKLLVTTVLALAMIGGSVGCAKKDKNADEIYSTATEYTEALINRDTKTINSLSEYDRDEEDELEAYVENIVSFSKCGENSKSVYKTILDETTYSASKKNIEIDDDKATISVTITMPDYEDVAEEEYTDVDTIISEIKKADKIEKTIKIKFERNRRDVWIITNTDSVVESFYAFEVDRPFEILNFSSSVEGFAQGIIDSDSEAICANIDYDDYSQEYCMDNLDYMFTFANYGDEGEVYAAIIDTFDYSVSYEDVNLDGYSESIKIDFTMVDYDAMMEDSDNLKSAENFIAAIPEAETKTVTVQLTLYNDGEWLIDEYDFDDALDDIYAFYSRVKLVDPLSDYVDTGASYWKEDKTVNASYMTYNLNFNTYVTGDFYYTLSKDGTLVYTSPDHELDYYSYYTILCYASDVTSCCGSDGNFKPGIYTITIYDSLFNSIIVSDSCTVINPYSGGSVDAFVSGNYVEFDYSFDYYVYGYYVTTYNGTVVENSGTYYTYYDWVYVTLQGAGTYGFAFYSPDGTLMLSKTYEYK